MEYLQKKIISYYTKENSTKCITIKSFFFPGKIIFFYICNITLQKSTGKNSTSKHIWIATVEYYNLYGINFYIFKACANSFFVWVSSNRSFSTVTCSTAFALVVLFSFFSGVLPGPCTAFWLPCTIFSITKYMRCPSWCLYSFLTYLLTIFSGTQYIICPSWYFF